MQKLELIQVRVRCWERWGLAAIIVALMVGCAGAEVVETDAPKPADPPTSSPASSPTSAASSAPALPMVALETEARDRFFAEPAQGGVIEAKILGGHVEVLASDAMEGRGVGTKGLDKAGDYLAEAFTSAGLKPAGDEGTWFQSFEVVTGTAIDSPRKQALKLGKGAVALGEGWRPFSFSASGKVSAEVVFAGYGISAPKLGYDDYAGLDVKGKIVVVLRHEPRRDDPHKKLGGGAKASIYSALRYKVHTAGKKGAAAIIVVNDPKSYKNPKEGDPDALYRFSGNSQGGVVAAHLTYAAAGALESHYGLDLEALQARIDKDYAPASVSTGKKAKIDVSIERTRATVRNVVGKIEVEGATESVVVGAHYDHLGHGGDGSLKPDSTDVHNGADDNASGTAIIIELARTLAKQRGALRRNIYVVGFSAEEIGIRGSQHFVDNPPEPIANIAAMVNFDMVGRLREDRLHVSGVGTAREFPALTDKAASGIGLKIVPGRDGYGPSDHSPFYAKRIPVLFMFTGAHDQYHTPDDDVMLINADGMAKIGHYAQRIVGYLAAVKARPTYTQADVRVASGDQGGTEKSGYGPYLGTVPSFGDTGGKGVKLQGIRGGSPAEKAGMKPGDTIVGFGGIAIKDLYDFTYALRDHKPGDKVAIKVQREGETLELEATLGKRK